MSAHIHTQLFSSASQDTWLDAILREQVDKAVKSMPTLATTGCLLTDMGDFLVRATDVLSHLANGVIYGQHINMYTKEKIQEMGRDHDFSQLNSLEYMNKKHESLKSLSTQLRRTAEDARKSWQNAPKPPIRQRREGSDPDSPLHLNLASMSSTSRPAGSESGWPTQPASLGGVGSVSLPSRGIASRQSSAGSPGSDGSPQHVTYNGASSLLARGTGQYQCPQGSECRKGGFREGRIVIFERNSAFRDHMQKHEKPYRCDLPGCTNRGGFARPDQLQRHQQVVRHI